MVVSFVLRLTESSLAGGQLVGEVEHVSSGARSRFRDADELSRWCTAVAGARIPTTRDEPGPVARA